MRHSRANEGTIVQPIKRADAKGAFGPIIARSDSPAHANAAEPRKSATSILRSWTCATGLHNRQLRPRACCFNRGYIASAAEWLDVVAVGVDLRMVKKPKRQRNPV